MLHEPGNLMYIDPMLDRLQATSIQFFERATNPVTGLVRDSSSPASNASIAATGFGLASLAAGAERGYITRRVAAERTLRALGFLAGAGWNGFFWHFLDPQTGERAGRSEISTIDSALLFAGALVSAEYFDRDDDTERRVRHLAETIYLSADWEWASPRHPVVSHGWTPERGFLRYDWRGYNEALLLYILALGSPTYPIPASAYGEWLASYKWKTIYGLQHVYGGPLFVHQTAHCWIDFRGIADSYMRARATDYFENSRRATYVHRTYAMRNPRGFSGYGENCWGVSASTGPASGRFHGYRARGAPFGPDDGTIAPWVVAASLPFAPEIVLPALSHLEPLTRTEHGVGTCFNHTYQSTWVAPDSYAIDHGPAVLMLENHRSGWLWRMMRKSPHIRRGLERAGFTGGWLEDR